MSNEALLNTLLTSTVEPVFVTDADSRLLRFSRVLETLVGWTQSEALGQPIERFAELCGQTEVAGLVRTASALGRICKGEVTLYGHTANWLLTVEPVLEGGRVNGCIGVFRNAAEGVLHQVGFDALTGLPNRELFNDRLLQALNNARRAGKSVAVMHLEVDRFGEMVDVLGRASGEKMLHEVSERLQQCLRTSDTVARLDEDRFALLMQITAVDDSVLLTEKIHQAFEKPLAPAEQNDVAVTCSVGISIFPTDGATPEELMKNSIIALSHAKHSGRNRSLFYSNDMNARAKHRMEIESGIRRALKNQEFLVYYQAKVDVAHGRVAGMEALVRWRDPEKGLVSPAEFIPVAEDSGLIEQIGLWVLEETCKQSCRWQAMGLPPVRASVNVSARQFRNRNFVASVAETLSATGLDPSLLELEITESMLMGDIEAIITRMEELRKLGVYLSIDDFGTGYSSLSYLSRFPITTLKIDRAFVRDVQSNPHTAEITRAIIGLSRGLELEVVAEGAEVKEEVEFLQANGCELVQGYFYGRPLPAEEFAAMLQQGIRPL